ncbi:MAG: hypothetical protein JOZ51_20015, partial [Chloroflexi bacterium]|nr:hypothetical protein [Chloroflexota bacterium]
MVALTTIQRDMLRALLTADAPLGLTELGQQVGMTARQVQYSLRALESWLHQRGAQLAKTPGIGVRVVGSSEQKQTLLNALTSERSFQLVLTAGQRQQILALQLLTTREPSILYQLQQLVDVSRTTLLKDLDVVEHWFGSFELFLERRPNYGCWLIDDELAQRQALAALLWGDTPFSDRLFAVSHTQGLIFFPSRDAALLPAIKRIADHVQRWDVGAAMQYVAAAEAEAGARFTDETVLQMALAFAIQRERVVAGRCLPANAERQRWLHERPIWKLALRLTRRMLPMIAEACLLSESAALAMYLLSAARESGSSPDLMVNDEFAELIAVLMREIAAAYHAPSLADDHILRDGLEAHIVPACVRQRFGLWAPRIAHDELGAEQFAFERGVAERLSEIVAERAGCILPPAEQHNLVLLVRAAAIRERPTHPQHVLICCPSGMATTQLLVARLKVRFPHLGTFEVVSLRDLTAQRLANADLIISTVPLQLPLAVQID